jgi:replicative DNA helicase
MAFKTSEWGEAPKSAAPKAEAGMIPQDDVTRALPHALGPEKSLLSSMLQDPLDWIGVAIEEKLTAAHFYLPNHALLFQYLCDEFEAGRPIELVSMVQKLLDRGMLDRVGGPSALTDLYTYAPSPGHFRHHVQMVKDKFVARSIIETGNLSIAEVYDNPEGVNDTLDTMEARVMAIREGQASNAEVPLKVTVNEIIEQFQALMDGKPDSKGLMTGFEDYDKMTGGLRPAEMHVVAARPSMGKTSFMMNIVENICLDQGQPTLVFTAEMSRFQLLQRLIYSRAKFCLAHMSRGYTPNKGDLQRIQRAALEVAKAPLIIDDTTAPTINYIRAKARRVKKEKGLEFLAGDYLQLFKSKSKQADSMREREIAEISAGIKGLTKDLGIPALILAQLNRGPEARNTTSKSGTKKGLPRMSDLRESGAIEQDADTVGLLYRDIYYAESDEDKVSAGNNATLVLAKNRAGETGNLPLTFVGELFRFETRFQAQTELEMFTPKTSAPSKGRFGNRGAGA